MSIKYKSNTKSLISGGEMVPIIDLGLHGFADSFFPSDQNQKAMQAVPLICMLDEETGLVQLLNLTEPDQRYIEIEYSYTSSNSQTAKMHWEDYVSYVRSLKPIEKSVILEIGSNDGFLLSVAKKFTDNVLGVDASPYVANLANSVGIETLVGTFGVSDGLKSMISDRYPKFDFIFANNVLNHSNDPVSFVREVADLLDDDGLFVFEVPYWLESITSLHFDQIYHEHVTYLTVKSSITLLSKADLHIHEVQVVDYHGGSLRVVASKYPKSASEAKRILLAREAKEGLCSPERYAIYSRAIAAKRDLFMNEVEDTIRDGKAILGVGAAAKANTLLTYYGFTPEIMKFVLDSSPHKQGKITPVTRIPIVDDAMVVGMQNGVGIVLAWNLSKPIQKKLLALNEELEFINI